MQPSVRAQPMLPPGIGVALAMLGALLASACSYRHRLLVAIQDPTQWADDPISRGELYRQLGSDAMLALCVAAMTWLVVLALLPLSRMRALRVLGLGLLSALLLLLGMLLQAQHGTLLAMRSGLTLELLKESLDPAAIRESWSLLPRSELPYLLMPLLGFWLSWLSLQLHRIVRIGFLLSIGVVTVALFTWAVRVPAAPLQTALLHHPLGFLATELVSAKRSQHALAQVGVGVAVANAATRNQAPAESGGPAGGVDGPPIGDDAADSPPVEEETQAVAPPSQARPQLALTDSMFAYLPSERAIQKAKPQAESGPLNVIVLILESTGADYALLPIQSGKLAMPFLHSLTEKGLFLRNHFSAGNSSPRGIFSLLSGLYVMPEVGIWDVRKDIYLPSLTTYLGSTYQHFLVTPASLDWYFPHNYLLHSGFTELWGYHNLPIRKNAPGGRAHARDEAESVSVFLQKLSTAAAKSEPFVAVYYSFLSHWPYPDYGPDSHVVPPTKALHLYLNNLHYLDKQIERIYERAKALGILDKTIVVIAGDHGEAFGQHPHNYTHSRQSFNENYRTPALLLHPQLFPPRVVSEPTSHVDFLPTILDAMGRSYDPQLLQGESLFQDHFRRKYIFLYGNEDTSSSISENQVKLQVSFRDGSCWVYDLRVDPTEQKRLSCAPHKAQYEALLEYRKRQRQALRTYNAVFRRELQQGNSPSAMLVPDASPVGRN